MRNVFCVGTPEKGGSDTGGGDGTCPEPTCLAQALSFCPWRNADSASITWDRQLLWVVFEVSRYKISLL